MAQAFCFHSLALSFSLFPVPFVALFSFVAGFLAATSNWTTMRVESESEERRERDENREFWEFGTMTATNLYFISMFLYLLGDEW